MSALSNYQKNKVHDRHIHAEECVQIGLVIDMIESDKRLQDLILTVHHCFMHTLMNTQAFKIVENHLGSALVKRQAEMPVPLLIRQPTAFSLPS